MKKYIVASMTIAMMLLTSACGGQSETSEHANHQQSSVTDTGVASSDQTSGAAKGGEQLVVKATNYQFDQPEYHVKKGKPVTIVFDNVQGNHGLMIPALNVNLNARDSSITVTPQEAGTFDMACSIMCGSGHSTMVAKLIVDEA
ncbi:cupredoxin domain-containing protein [Paenibacillus dauci]|uniref:cupredoxin domain-containing protein n=1 Tax=Paenibacillus dauci TaxID=1567106 RepID=UPI000619E807|nr:cupredoxin domain-containing protein [Paenibacillus dauci]